MATFRERLDKTEELLQDPNITPKEAFTHLYNFLRFELAVAKLNHQKRVVRKYAQKLNADLEVFNFRNKMSEL